MRMESFPRLKLPLNRTTLTPDQGRQLLAYDITQRLVAELISPSLDAVGLTTLLSDADANMHGLGTFIRENLGPDRFDDEVVDDGTVFESKVE
jgi:regulator of RNase E activity RraB